MVDDEKLHEVNVNKVAKNVLSIGLFGLFQIEDEFLVATHWFILSVTEEQFWKIQCKLEAKQKNVWLFKGKDGFQPCTGASIESVYELYQNLVYGNLQEIKRTSLIMGGIELFTDAQRYIGIQTKHLDMLDYSPTVKMEIGRESAIVDDVHVFTIVSKEHTVCKYLKPLSAC